MHARTPIATSNAPATVDADAPLVDSDEPVAEPTTERLDTRPGGETRRRPLDATPHSTQQR